LVQVLLSHSVSLKTQGQSQVWAIYGLKKCNPTCCDVHILIETGISTYFFIQIMLKVL